MHFGILRQSTMDGGKCTFPFLCTSLSLSLFLYFSAADILCKFPVVHRKEEEERDLKEENPGIQSC
jgi:hypothetical protein